MIRKSQTFESSFFHGMIISIKLERGMKLLFTITLYLHILSVIVATGPLFAIFPILKRMEKAQTHDFPSYITALQGLLRAVANGGHFIVPTGFVLIYFSGWSWTSPWLIVTYIVMGFSLYFMALAFKPAMNFAKSAQFEKEQFIHMMKSATWKYIFLMGFFLWLMIAKPDFW
ncbi:DUF2269 family protein [Solibacillus sp. A46]|uniref:DUF2269 family protein n=2 Tax=Solibacillus faecavium TaxID=2762221 RepID=A0ABR8Y250_9BACL|nr:DUF2269 family protein [Solibacillus faecavium]